MLGNFHDGTVPEAHRALTFALETDEAILQHGFGTDELDARFGADIDSFDTDCFDGQSIPDHSTAIWESVPSSPRIINLSSISP